MTNTLNIIHLPNNPNYPHRKMREDNFLKEIQEQGIKDYKVWEAIFIEDNSIKAISQSHKMIVQDAKEKKLPSVMIAEDDFSFTAKGGWDYFLNKMPEDFDLYLSHVYDGRWDDNGKIKGPFSSLTLYCIHEQFYDKFLAKPEDEHLDLVMNKAWRHNIYVCLPMVCRQLNGWSENSKEFKDWLHREINKPIYQ